MSGIDMHRRRLIYRGHVQGVGFRYTSQQIARAYAVSGFVRNLSDGTVELCLSGSSSEVGRYLAAIAERLAANIEHVDDLALAPDIVLPAGFEIRR